mgnify:CR=1 FL=1
MVQTQDRTDRRVTERLPVALAHADRLTVLDTECAYDTMLGELIAQRAN